MTSTLFQKLTLLFLIAATLGCELDNSTSKVVPFQLSTEAITNPTKIIDATPEFGWVLPSTTTYQESYQILVASSKKNIKNNYGDLWDNKHKSSQSQNIEYKGKVLSANNTYYWKVRTTNDEGVTSEYSKPQSFTISSSDDLISSSDCLHYEYIKPKQSSIQNNTAFVDFGKAAFATLRFRYKTTSPKLITIHLGERAIEGKVDRKPKGKIRYQKVELQVTPNQESYLIVLTPDQRNTKSAAIALPDSIPTLLPFQFAEFEGVDKTFDPEKVEQIAVFHHFNSNASDFSSSDPVLNQVWDLCKYTMKATSFAGVYIDGDRERIPYEADAYINQLSHYVVDHEYSIARKTIEYFMKHPTWPTEWQQHVPLLFYQDYMYTGNTELIERYYEPLKHKTLMALEVEDGFISIESKNHNGELMAKLGFADTTKRMRDIVDWPPAQKDTGWKVFRKEGERDGFEFSRINTVVNSFYYANLVIMAEFASVLNKTEEEADFRSKAVVLKKAINEKLYNKEEGFYVDGIGSSHGAVHSNMLPLAFDIVPDDQKERVADYVASRGMACSVYGSQYFLEALYKGERGKKALDFMRAKTDRSWWNMLQVGATMTMEAWDLRDKPNSDWNHAWGSAPANIIARYMWGIQPQSPGFSKVLLRPRLGDLTQSSIEYPTVKGKITGRYKQSENGNEMYTFVLPGNVTALLELNQSNKSNIKIDDKTYNGKPEAIVLTSGIHTVEVY